MPSQQRIRRDDGVELEQSPSSYRFGLARQKSPLSVGKADAPSPQPCFKQSVLCLKELDDDELMAMNPTGSDNQQKWPSIPLSSGEPRVGSDRAIL